MERLRRQIREMSMTSGENYIHKTWKIFYKKKQTILSHKHTYRCMLKTC